MPKAENRTRPSLKKIGEKKAALEIVCDGYVR
jgi:hypothetical protein